MGSFKSRVFIDEFYITFKIQNIVCVKHFHFWIAFRRWEMLEEMCLWCYHQQFKSKMASFKSRVFIDEFFLTFFCIFSHFCVGSMCLMRRLHLTRSCASSPDSSISNKSFLMLSNHLHFGHWLFLSFFPRHLHRHHSLVHMTYITAMWINIQCTGLYWYFLDKESNKHNKKGSQVVWNSSYYYVKEKGFNCMLMLK